MISVIIVRFFYNGPLLNGVLIMVRIIMVSIIYKNGYSATRWFWMIIQHKSVCVIPMENYDNEQSNKKSHTHKQKDLHGSPFQEKLIGRREKPHQKRGQILLSMEFVIDWCCYCKCSLFLALQPSPISRWSYI